MQQKPSKPSSNPKKRPFDNYLKYSNIAFQLVAAILIGVFGGIKLDEWLGTDSAFTIILSLLGVFAGLYLVLKEFLKPPKKE